MKDIVIPDTYNYIAVFLSLSCNYHCSYCINYFEEGKFTKRHLSGEDWVRGYIKRKLNKHRGITLNNR